MQKLVRQKLLFYSWGSAAIFVATLFFVSCVFAETINLEVIKTIESGGNSMAFNSRTKCYGLYQISLVCLKDFNQICKKNLQTQDLFNPAINKMVAVWYFKRIRQMLNFYKIPVSITTIIASYNWGIGNVIKWNRSKARLKYLPKVTRKYIVKYLELTRKNALSNRPL